MQIENIQKLVNQNKIKWSVHAVAQMQERDISITDVKSCITSGEIIEDYPDDFPYPSCLIYGQAEESKVLHVVVGTDEEILYIITAYIPNPVKFEEDLKTRRK